MRAEGRRQRAEGRGQRAEGRRQRAEGRENAAAQDRFISLKNREPIHDCQLRVPLQKNRSGQKLPDLFPTQKTTEDKNVLCAADAQKNESGQQRYDRNETILEIPNYIG